MLQRFQSLFLILGAVFILLCFILPIWISPVKIDGKEAKSILMIYQEQLSYPSDSSLNGINNTGGFQMLSSGLGIVLAIALVWVVFQYNNRIKQALIVRVLMLLSVLFMGSLFLGANELQNKYGVKGEYQIAILLSSFVPILCFIASRLIMKDEKLVRSAERFR